MSAWNIYVMSNPSMPGIVKIGGSVCPESRRDQLSANTAVPTPFVLEYVQSVDFGRDTEGTAHLVLAGARVSPTREFFRVRKYSGRRSMKLDALEALTNAAVGLVVSWAATFFVLGYSAAGSAAVTAMFFCLSFARAWALRAIFRKVSS